MKSVNLKNIYLQAICLCCLFHFAQLNWIDLYENDQNSISNEKNVALSSADFRNNYLENISVRTETTKQTNQHQKGRPDDRATILKGYRLKCVEETKVDADYVLRLKTGDWHIDNLPLQKWALCVLVHAGIMSKQGVFQINEALALVPERDPNQVLDRVDACLSKKRKLPHEIAWLYLKCMNRSSPKEFEIV